MSDLQEKQTDTYNNDDWPLSMDKEFLGTGGMQNIAINYYRDPNTGEICTDRTLRALFQMFNFYQPSQSYPNAALSTYMSIMNVFTYPDLQILAPKLPSLIGLRLRPTPMTDLKWLQDEISHFNTPLSSDDQMAALAIYTLLLDFKTYPFLMASAREVCASIGVFHLQIVDELSFRCQHWTAATAFMKSAFNIPFCKYIYDCLVRKAVVAENKRAEHLLRLCGTKMPTVLSCKTTFIPPLLN